MFSDVVMEVGKKYFEELIDKMKMCIRDSRKKRRKKKQRHRKRNDLDSAAGSCFPCGWTPEKEGRRAVKGK